MKTLTAYKLFARKKSRPGEIFPLFIGKNTPTPIGQWVPAEFIPTPGFAERPGWHVGRIPKAQHLMCLDGTMPDNRVWAEVQIPAEIDWTAHAQTQPTKDLRRQIPVGGFYRFPRPANQGGEWMIAGAIMVVRLLSDEEAAEIVRLDECPKAA